MTTPEPTMSEEVTMPPNDLDSVRDEVARLSGWTEGRVGSWGKFPRPAYVDFHPCPPTLDGAANAMPEGWLWRKCGVPSQWNAAKSGDCWVDGVYVPDTGDEIADRYRLALLALRREGDGK